MLLVAGGTVQNPSLQSWLIYVTLCSGSLGARPDNDLPGMMQRLGDKVHFLHLRNVRRETPALRGSFHEAEHLGGDTDMVALLAAALAEETRRKEAGRQDWSIPFRPDHGQDILDIPFPVLSPFKRIRVASFINLIKIKCH